MDRATKADYSSEITEQGENDDLLKNDNKRGLKGGQLYLIRGLGFRGSDNRRSERGKGNPRFGLSLQLLFLVGDKVTRGRCEYILLCSINLLLCLGSLLVFLVGLGFMRFQLVALCFFTPLRTLCNQSTFIELRELVGLSLFVTCGTTVSTVIVITKTYRYIIFLLLTLM